MPKKKPNKFLKINDKVISLPKPALGQKKSPKPLYGNTYPNGRVLDVDPFQERRDAEEMSKQFLEAVEQGLIDPKDTKYPRHLRKLAE